MDMQVVVILLNTVIPWRMISDKYKTENIEKARPNSLDFFLYSQISDWKSQSVKTASAII
jgi:hypothetical protein